MKFLKTGKVVLLLGGRYAGKKAVIIKPHDDGTEGRAYGHALVCGLSKEPRKVTKRLGVKKLAKRSSLKAFVKVVNYQHLMPTRYSLTEVNLKSLVTPELLQNKDAKIAFRKEAKKLLEAKFKTGGNKWFFSKLRF
uniref:60S ribosomal protein L27 n=1 Tax=Polytomella parva TaxID=51329 RepID=A0A7S0YD97_9CHLO|mmetsp:Transcript_19141/g.34636  ORF Transcript_19141/g.34636 Transcript_19141/m.34636 type:complete len:136 (+) Transcript_19141:48-455(+)|eukprot:CAMPEP_0175038734 /NCGR_PEP_ID=MMETSP0052_2-20121109/44_1 /TAXON_ID=51329 ORGANISM="Polytomella parva, Strain SAG 63-3" /NCGR_SAMPLE_ID=MMETSP0052_2 /ASSEMBLY_ACC=CAM_ASM_000194 /LENGTH=135 /DNA_ID=CAMNT_0016300211 /DNA_START=1294 /DNA_END=1701 /DNA_ORIENTATION=+